MKEVMNLKEAMDYIGFKDEQCFRKNCRLKKIPSRLIGGDYKFSKTALDMWLAGMNLEDIYKKIADIQMENAIKLMA